jgi:hypothetical protein
MKITRRITLEKFEEVEKILTAAGVINHAEWFCRGGAQFVARGCLVDIQPRSFNGAEWVIDIESTSLQSVLDAVA